MCRSERTHSSSSALAACFDDKAVFGSCVLMGAKSQQCFGASFSREGCCGESCLGGSGRQSVFLVARFALARRKFPGGEQCALQWW